MRRIELDDDEDGGGANGLMALVVAVMELLVEAMEREAVRRMESGALTPEEIERLGGNLQAIDEEIRSMKQREGIDDDVDRLRGDLDSLVSDAVEQVRASEDRR